MVGPRGWGQWRWMSRLTLKISDTGSYSDMVCGLMPLLGFDYRPQLADLPDAKLWRITPGADYGPLNTAAGGQIDLGRVRAHWPDLLRLVGSIHTSAVSAHDVLRMLQHGGNPTQLGEALAPYGRSSRPCTCCPTSIRRPTGRRSRACATYRKAATPWRDTSSTAAAVISGRPTSRAWRTSSGRSGWS